MENAIRISPHDPRSAMFYSQLAAAHFDAEDFETAVVWAQKALTISSGAPPNANTSIASLVRLASLIHLGQPTGQKADVERIEPIASGLERTAGIFSLRIKANTKERILENLRRAALLD